MTRDRIYAAELAHDTSGASDREVEACMGEAMDDLIWRLFDGQKVGKWALCDFLIDMEDKRELAQFVSAALTSDDFMPMRDEIERRLRAELADTDTLHDRAAAIANERGERE